MTVSDTTPTAVNETLVAGFPSYVRWNDEAKCHEINMRIDPRVDNEQWARIPQMVRDTLCEGKPLPLGNYVYRWARAEQYLLEADTRRIKELNDAYHAIEIIGTRLIQEAEKRGWCEDFDRIIDEVNEEMPGSFMLPTREKNFEVEVEVTATVTFTHTISVTARNEEEAESIADSDIDSFVDLDDAATDHVRYNSFDQTDWAVTRVYEV